MIHTRLVDKLRVEKKLVWILVTQLQVEIFLCGQQYWLSVITACWLREVINMIAIIP